MSDEIREDTKKSNIYFDMFRVTPAHPKRLKNPKNDRLTDLIFMIFIFGIAFWFRFLFYTVFFNQYGQSFTLTIAKTDPFGFGHFLGVKPGNQVNTDGYNDFFAYYIPYVQAFGEGWNPYTGSRSPGDSIGGYVYGPFYMYSIALGNLWFGLTPTESIIFSNIILDSLSFVVVYLLAKRVTGNVVALIFSVVGSFSPINLFYIAYRGLNAPIMNLIFLLFVYFLLEKRDNLSMLFLALAILTKQFPLFMAMPMGFWMVRRYGFFKGVGYYIRGIVFFLLLSMPYIVWTPYNYIVKLFAPGNGKSTINCPNGSEATNLFNGMIPVKSCIVENGKYVGVDTSQLPSGYQFIFSIVNSHVLFFSSIIILALVAFAAYDYFEEDERLYYVFNAAYFGIVHATIARGIYKYYLTFLVPLFLLGFIVGDREKSLHVRIGNYLNHYWRTWFHPSNRQKEASAEYWSFGLLLLLVTFGVFWLIVQATSLISFNNDNQMLFIVVYLLIAVFCIIRPGGDPIVADDEKTEITYSYDAIVYLGLFLAALFFTTSIAGYYFNSSTAYFSNLTNIVFLGIGILILPVFAKYLFKSESIYSPFTFDLPQLILDAIRIIIVYEVMVYFHIQVFLIFRFYITLFILLFSFIFIGLLGKQVLWSPYYATKAFLSEYKRLKLIRMKYDRIISD